MSFAKWLCSSSHQDVKSVLPLLEPQLTMWLVLTNRMQQRDVTVANRGLKRLCMLSQNSFQLPCEQVWEVCWQPPKASCWGHLRAARNQPIWQWLQMHDSSAKPRKTLLINPAWTADLQKCELKKGIYILKTLHFGIITRHQKVRGLTRMLFIISCFLGTPGAIHLPSSLELLKDSFLWFQMQPLKCDPTLNVFKVSHWKEFWSRWMFKLWVSFSLSFFKFEILLSQR